MLIFPFECIRVYNNPGFHNKDILSFHLSGHMTMFGWFSIFSIFC